MSCTFQDLPQKLPSTPIQGLDHCNTGVCIIYSFLFWARLHFLQISLFLYSVFVNDLNELSLPHSTFFDSFELILFPIFLNWYYSLAWFDSSPFHVILFYTYIISLLFYVYHYVFTFCPHYLSITNDTYVTLKGPNRISIKIFNKFPFFLSHFLVIHIQRYFSICLNKKSKQSQLCFKMTNYKVVVLTNNAESVNKISVENFESETLKLLSYFPKIFFYYNS